MLTTVFTQASFTGSVELRFTNIRTRAILHLADREGMQNSFSKPQASFFDALIAAVNDCCTRREMRPCYMRSCLLPVDLSASQLVCGAATASDEPLLEL